MAIRLNQEALAVAVPKVTSTGGNVRVNQEALLVGVNAASSPGHTRVNQLALMMLVPANLVGQKVQITGGPFQDALGNALSNGYLIFQLQHDAVALYADQIVGGAAVRVPLDTNGYIQGTVTGAPVYLWPNDVLLPANGNYIIWAYDSSNRQVWNNPQIQQVKSIPSPFSVNAWIPGP